MTKVTGNPSEQAVAARAEKYSVDRVRPLILPASQVGLELLHRALYNNADPQGILMLGANAQLSSVVMELAGAHKEGGLFGSATLMRSTAAEKLKDFALANGIKIGTVPISPLISWCLRSYALALEYAEPRKVPCIFLHVNTIRLGTESHVQTAELFLQRFQTPL